MSRGGRREAPPLKRCKRCRLIKPDTSEYFHYTYYKRVKSKLCPICKICVAIQKQQISGRPEYLAIRNARHNAKRGEWLAKRLPAGYVPAIAAAKQVGYTRQYLCILVRERKVKGKRIGARVYVSMESLTRYIQGTLSEPQKQCSHCGETDKSKLRFQSGYHRNICIACHNRIRREEREMKRQTTPEGNGHSVNER